MSTGLGIAGLICIAMAFGHETIGSVWVLTKLDEERLPSTPFGPRSMTASMIHVTWHVVTVFVFALGGVLITLGWGDVTDPRMVMLRWFAAMWLAATAWAGWVVWPRLTNLRSFLRLPVPVLWVIVAVLCWEATT